LKLPHRRPTVVDAGAVAGVNLLVWSRCVGGAPVRLAIAALIGALLSGCSEPTPVVPATESAEMVQKNCADQHWKDQNLGLWYSVCRTPMRW
jgi:hypothetical protein